MPKSNRLSLAARFPSDRGQMHEFLEELFDRIADVAVTAQEAYALQMSLAEAIANAVKHGNRSDPSKQVCVSCRVDRRWLWARVEDEGDGFDRAVQPDPTRPENLERPSGRGLYLMQHFMDLVEHNDRGNVVTLFKSRPGAPIVERAMVS